MAKTSNTQAIAQRYATALFELAEENKKLKAVAGELESLRATLNDSDAMARLCQDPTISKDERYAAIEALVKKAKSSDLVKNFLSTLASNGRMDVLPEVLQDFARRLYEKNDELVAEVISSAPMKKAQQTKLQKMLKEHFGKNVALELHVNESLLGGLRVRVGGQLIDASVQGRLQRLESHLNAGIQQIV